VLIEDLKLKVPELRVKSMVVSGAPGQIVEGDKVIVLEPIARYDLREPVEHLKYALRYEPVSLAVFKKAFLALGPDIVRDWVKSEPTGIFARRAWWLYESLTGQILDLPDRQQGGYSPLLDPEIHITGVPIRSRRHRITVNLPGTIDYCPLIRRTEKLKMDRFQNLRTKVHRVIDAIDPSVLSRAVNHFYTTETKSSYALEREAPKQERADRFVAALKQTNQFNPGSKEDFVALQHIIVDPRYIDHDWRTSQVYIGQTLADMSERVHFACPPPGSVPSLMSGWMECADRTSVMDPVCQAAALSFGFVFIHPFGNGNGRIHRFLIHHFLQTRGFSPKDMILPVSAVMLRKRQLYDAALETYSASVMPLIGFELDSYGEMTSLEADPDLYRYFDATPLAEFLYDAIEECVEEDLRREIGFIQVFDEAKQRIQDIVDMPDSKFALLFKHLWQNECKLSKRKRSEFEEIDDSELSRIEAEVRSLYDNVWMSMWDSEKQSELPFGDDA